MSTFPARGRRAAPPTRQPLTEEQRGEVREAFELFDTDKDGFIDYHELKVALRALGFNLRKPEVLKLLREHDRGDGLMSLADFEKISESRTQQLGLPWERGRSALTPVTEKILSRDPMEELRRAFSLFDDDHTGKISLKNLRRVAKELGEHLGDEEL
jgi:centrin-3